MDLNVTFNEGENYIVDIVGLLGKSDFFPVVTITSVIWQSFADTLNGATTVSDGQTNRDLVDGPVGTNVGTSLMNGQGRVELTADFTRLTELDAGNGAVSGANGETASHNHSSFVYNYALSDGTTGRLDVRVNGVDDGGDHMQAIGNANAEYETGDGDDMITDLAGDGRLIGGQGADAMIGGAGNDVYDVENIGDTVIEQAINGGTDTVYSTLSHTLADNVENVILKFGDNLDATGNDLTNLLAGNAGANTLDGRGGTDMMLGSGGNDTYIIDQSDLIIEYAGEGNDTVRADFDYTLLDHFENLEMGLQANIGTGNALANTITGNDGNNILDGGAGTDILIGGAGDDIYILDNSADLVTETDQGGTDTVMSSADIHLSANVEALVLTGNAVTGWGNDQSNHLYGNDGVNVLFGRGGSDYMVGGEGDDIFIIVAEDGAVDVIGDFTGAGVAGGDRLGFSAADFGRDGVVKQLSQTSFEVASADGSVTQQFILTNMEEGNGGLEPDDYYFD
ncbi:calcium-binding protein [Ahrensia sp. R2A130]|uniref:calcium-binding protein n=1 Tax=Ahrensia sp. R2A130 TaxID=744979 RepID=UPI0001E0844B|nr:calcium-binding protein [Ahrensia sp. R2A130]EFL88102.1 rhizobiocin/RTX toxin and hemolysin-type calcium binding protein [Ahrensia sp. R2A130]